MNHVLLIFDETISNFVSSFTSRVFYSVSLKEFCIKTIKIYGNEYMLYFTILFFFSRVVRLFRANQQKKASLSLVKITEEFKMQVVKQEKYELK